MTRHIIAGVALFALAACDNATKPAGKVGPDGSMTSADVAKEVAQIKLTPGQWRIESEVVSIDTPGIPKEVQAQMAGRKTTVEICIKPEDVERPDVLAGQRDANCSYRDFNMRGGRMSGTMSCKGGENGGGMTMNMSGQYAADRYDITTDMKMEGSGGEGGMAIKARANGARVGECPATKG